MGASKQKKVRKEQEAVKQEIILEDAKQRRSKNRKIVLIVAAVAVLIAACILYINSASALRTLTAVRVGDMSFSAAEFNYHYKSAYSEYYAAAYSMFGDNASEFLPASTKPFSEQIHDEATKQTWQDFFRSLTMSTLEEDVSVYAVAKASGFELSEQAKQSITDKLDTVTYMAEQFNISEDKYVQDNYGGKGMTVALYEKCLEFQTVAEEYKTFIKEGFSYSDEEIEAAYNENSGVLDVFRYRYFHVALDEYDAEDYGGDEAAAKQAAIDASLVKAQEYAGRIHSEADLIAVAKECNIERYEDESYSLMYTSGSLLPSAYGDWVRDESRQKDDVTALPMSNGSYVMWYDHRDRNEYSMADVYVVPVSEIKGSVADDAFEAALERAEGAIEEFISAGADDEAAERLAAGYGLSLYADAHKTTPGVGTEAAKWLFEESRSAGDYTLIRTSTGYNFVYVASVGGIYREYLGEDRLRTADYSEWEKSLEQLTAKKRLAFGLVG